MFKILIYINHDVELDHFCALVYKLSFIPNVRVEIFLAEKWMREDCRILKLIQRDRVTMYGKENIPITNSILINLFDTLIRLRRKLDLDLKWLYRSSTIISQVDPIESFLDEIDLLIIDNTNYEDNPRFSKIVDQDRINIWVYPCSPTKVDINKTNQLEYKRKFNLHSRKHKILVSGPNSLFFRNLNKSMRNQTKFIGDLRYDPDYLNFISGDLKLIVIFISPHCY